MKAQDGKIIRFLQNNALQLAITLFSVLITLGNIYLTSKLRPVVDRLDAVEKAEAVNLAQHDDFVRQDVLSATLNPMLQDIKDIKGDVKSVKDFLLQKVR